MQEKILNCYCKNYSKTIGSNMKKNLLLIILLFCFLESREQTFNPYAEIDAYVVQKGKMDSFNLNEITKSITENIVEKKLKCRAIYYWIANQINLDPKITQNQSNDNIQPEIVIKTRKTSPSGFSLLFQEMCSLCGIRCLVVDGYSRWTSEDIGLVQENINHSWNVVQLGNSNEEWYYVDVAKASGYFNDKGNIFYKQFSGDYFFTKDATFNLDHFPSNKAWMLGHSNLDNKRFYNLPIIGNAAYQIELSNMLPKNGLIHAQSNKPLKFEIEYKNRTPITNILAIVIEGKKQQKEERINFMDSNSKITFNYTFKKETTLLFTILSDNKILLTYNVEVEE